jgi:serine/threonine protein kinase
MLDSGSALTVGHIVPDYELLRRIGRGSYGEVWLARSKATGVLRAAKIVWRHTFDDDRPFQREFEGIQHFERISRELPSQLALFHIGRNEGEGCFYYVMELADNTGTAEVYAPRTLRADLQHGRLPAERVFEIGLALTEALGHLHGNSLVHRDVKPSNVIFVSGRPKLADIGLVTDSSDTHSIVGTEGYLPPEGPGTPQADIFALGKVLYEAATGLDRHQFPKLPPDLRSWPDAGRVLELNEILLKACDADRRQRYSDAQGMLAELQLLQKGKSVKRKRTYQKWVGACKMAALVSACLALVAVALVFGLRQLAPPDYSTDGPPSTNADATALCEKGMLILRGDNYAELGTAYSNFNAAISLDPNFVRPYFGLLEFRFREDVDIPGLPGTTKTKQELQAMASKLKRLAPHSPATYCAQSIVEWNDWNYPEANRFALEAIKADPKYELGHSWDAWVLGCFGWPEESRKQAEIARTLAPSKTIVYRLLGNADFAARDYTSAIKWYQTATNWEPHHFVPYEYIGRALQAMGDYTNALVFLERYEILSGSDEAAAKQRYATLRRALDNDGIRGYWQQQWNWTETNTGWDSEGENGGFYWKAVVQIHLRNTNSALDWLEKSCETRERDKAILEHPLARLLYDEYWDGLRDNPRFKKLLATIGFSKVMPKGGR